MSEETKSKVDDETRDYREALRASEKDRKESERMQKLYTGYDKGQWSINGKNALLARGSMVPQINLLKGKIKGLAGSVIKNFFDVNFVPVSTAETPLTRKLNGIFTSDSNMFDYDTSYLKCTINGLIHQGIEQMKLSTRYSPLGNIVFDNILPGNILIDPFWTSDDTWDINDIWKVAYLTPQEIVNKYGHRNDRVRDLLMQIEMNGMPYDDGKDADSAAGPYWNLNSSYGHKYRVIEHHYLETEVQTLRFAKIKEGAQVAPTNDQGEEIELPQGQPDFDALDIVGVDKNEAEVITRRVEKKIYKIATSCQEIDQFKLLENGKADIQIGRLPFFPFSADRHGGRNCGIAILMEDTQVLINSREAKADDLIATSIEGAHLIDPLLFGNDDAMTNRAIKEMSKPGAKIKTAAGMLANGRELIKPIQKAPYAGELVNEIDRLTGYLDSLSGQTATLDGQKESSHDTGTLFSQRALQSEIALTVLSKSLEAHQRDKFEAWMLYAPKVYGGPYREIVTTNKDGERETITLNVRVYSDDEIEVQSDMTQLRRHKVIVTKSKDGLTVRETDRNRNIELLNVVTSPIKRTILEQNAVDTLENSAKQKADLRKYYDLELTYVVTQMEAEISQMRATIAQTNAQTMQIAQQVAAGPEQQGALQGGGAPAQQQQGGEQQPVPEQASGQPDTMNNQLKQ